MPCGVPGSDVLDAESASLVVEKDVGAECAGIALSRPPGTAPRRCDVPGAQRADDALVRGRARAVTSAVRSDSRPREIGLDAVQPANPERPTHQRLERCVGLAARERGRPFSW
jgi:hypothetical protein